MKFLLLTLMLLTACTTTYAQDLGPTPTPTPTPMPPAPSPTGLSFTAGLERPTDTDNPGPFLSGRWDSPSSEVREIALEITRIGGRGPVWERRNQNRGRGWIGQGAGRSPQRNIDERDTDKIWFVHETNQEKTSWVYQIWDDAGCDLWEEGFRITQTCKYWYDQIWQDRCAEDSGQNCATLRHIRDIRAGSEYELRVFWCDELPPSRSFRVSGNWFTRQHCNGSDYHRVTVPRPATPTATPTPTRIPTATPRPTSTPRPTATPGPTQRPTETPVPESQLDPLFKDNPALVAVWYRDNSRQRWVGYVRGDENQQWLKSLKRGQPYWVEVSRSATVEGHRLYCMSESCVNLIAW